MSERSLHAAAEAIRDGRKAGPGARSLLWVDAFVETRDPSARQLLHALPHLQATGWRVSIWCLRSDAPRDGVEHVFLPTPPLPGALMLFYFAVVANLYGLWRWLTGQPRPAEVIHTTCGMYFGADLASVHFVNAVWLQKQLELGFEKPRELLQFCLHLGGAVLERLHWWCPRLRKALPVSDSVGEEVRKRCRPALALETLPNAYDETRFTPAARRRFRPETRAALGWLGAEVVFTFVSLGHHKRKGFWLAVEALALVRARGFRQARFLVVGGLPLTLAGLQARLDRTVPDWREWITFTGAQTAVEQYLAAADAFLYPSYFEAFCLAEIEAAALGLPLLLTPHHGTEMILRDGVNGLVLSYEPGEMAETLAAFMTEGPGRFRLDLGQALTRAAYAQRLGGVYEGLR